METRTVIITSNGDWTDAGYDDLKVPVDMDLEKEHQAYRDWYKSEYVPKLHTDARIDYKDFPEFLLEKGAERAALEKFHDN